MVVNFDVDFVDLGFLDDAVELIDWWRRGHRGRLEAQPRIGRSAARRAPGRDRGVLGAAPARLRVARERHPRRQGHQAGEPADPLVQACQFGGDIFDTELILRAERTGLTVRELPVSVADQRPPRTPISRRIPRSLWGLVGCACLASHRPSPAALTPRSRGPRPAQHPQAAAAERLLLDPTGGPGRAVQLIRRPAALGRIGEDVVDRQVAARRDLRRPGLIVGPGHLAARARRR